MKIQRWIKTDDCLHNVANIVQIWTGDIEITFSFVGNADIEVIDTKNANTSRYLMQNLEEFLNDNSPKSTNIFQLTTKDIEHAGEK